MFERMIEEMKLAFASLQHLKLRVWTDKDNELSSGSILADVLAPVMEISKHYRLRIFELELIHRIYIQVEKLLSDLYGNDVAVNHQRYELCWTIKHNDEELGRVVIKDFASRY